MFNRNLMAYEWLFAAVVLGVSVFAELNSSGPPGTQLYTAGAIGSLCGALFWWATISVAGWKKDEKGRSALSLPNGMDFAYAFVAGATAVTIEGVSVWNAGLFVPAFLLFSVALALSGAAAAAVHTVRYGKMPAAEVRVFPFLFLVMHHVLFFLAVLAATFFITGGHHFGTFGDTPIGDKELVPFWFAAAFMVIRLFTAVMLDYEHMIAVSQLRGAHLHEVPRAA